MILTAFSTVKAALVGLIKSAADFFGMMKYVVAYAGAAMSFLVFDLLWLGLVAKNFYREHLGHLLADQVNVAAAVGFYFLYIGGIVIFAIAPAFASGHWRTAALFGALFGFFAYATYDLTNLATIRNWPVAVTVVDLAWGTLVTGVVATLGYLMAKQLVTVS